MDKELEGRGLEDLVGGESCACLRFLGVEVVELGQETLRGVDVVDVVIVDESSRQARVEKCAVELVCNLMAVTYCARLLELCCTYLSFVDIGDVLFHIVISLQSSILGECLSHIPV